VLSQLIAERSDWLEGCPLGKASLDVIAELDQKPPCFW
jgi:hypothetical protein